MRKFFSLLAVLLITLLALASSLAFAQEATEEASEAPSFTFPQLVDGEAMEGDFSSSSMQLYTLLGSEGDLVSITMAAAEGSSIDSFLIVVGPNGEVLGYNDDANGFDSAIEDLELPVDGIYFVLATTYAEIREQTASEETPLEDHAYILTASGFTQPTDLGGVSGHPVESNEDGTVDISGDLTIETGNPVVYIFFQATAGQTISFTTAPSESDNALIDPMMYLFSSTGARLISMDDTEDSLFPSFEIEAPADGIYMAFLTAYGYEQAPELEDEYLGYGNVSVTLSVE